MDMSRVSGGKNITVCESSASSANETHRRAISQSLCAVPLTRHGAEITVRIIKQQEITTTVR